MMPVTNSARLQIRHQYMHLEPPHRRFNLGFGSVAASGRVDRILDEQNVPACRRVQTAVQRTVGQDDLLMMCNMYSP